MAKKSKGSLENPYTMSECERMLDAGTWPGGYVRDDAGKVTYVMKSVTVNGYSGSGSGSESGSGGSDYEFSDGSTEWHYPDTETGCDDDGKGNPGTDGGGGAGGGGNVGGGGGTGGGTPGYTHAGAEPNAGEGDENDVSYYTIAEIDDMMEKGTWPGGYVKDFGYVPPKVLGESRPLPYASSGEEIYQRALKYANVPYKRGGTDMNGIDCSGLVSVALGLEKRWTTKSGDIPGFKKMVYTSDADLRKGDILVWRWTKNGTQNGHAAIYVEGNYIFHAHGSTGSPTNKTGDLNTYWLNEKYIPVAPVIYRRED